MRAKLQNRRRGQVLVMVTLALLAMCGMLGLVVDLGWSYYVTKSAQAAADAGAIAAVKAAEDIGGGANPATAYQCGAAGLACGTYDCLGAPANLERACWYAQQHGFTTAGRQHVTVTAADRDTAPTVTENCGQGGAEVKHPPTTGCVDVFYWATVRVAEEIPQLFSSVFGNSTGMASARATAAVARVESLGALYLLGHENDPWNPSGGKSPTGTNLYMGGSGDLNVPGGIVIASTSDQAGFISGTGDITAPFTAIAAGGNYDIQGSGTWTATPTTSTPSSSSMFQDPYSGMGQPPISTSVLQNHPVLNGSLTCNPCLPGNYYAVNVANQATGAPLTINTTVSFSSGGNWGDYNFFGGLQIAGAQVTFGPGRYVLAGVADAPMNGKNVNNSQTPLFNNDNNSMLLSSGANGTDAGRIFILTDSNYPGLDVQVNQIPNRIWPGPAVTNDDGGSASNSLYFSKSSIKTGNNANSSVELNGLNVVNLPAGVGAETNSTGTPLSEFALAPVQGQGAGVLFWQDQRNSYIHYLDDGVVDTTCGTDPCLTKDYSAMKYPFDPETTPQLEIWATPHADLQGVIYQPRGAWTLMQASGNYTGPMRIVTGNLKIQGSGNLSLTGPSPAILTYKTALIE